MRDLLGERRVVYLIWAVALVASLAFTGAEAQALHTSCWDLCDADCGGSCKRATPSGCSCDWVCVDGSTGSHICNAE